MGTFAQTTNLPNNFGTIVYQSNNYYYAQDSKNNILTSSGVPEFVIKTALDRGGDIYIAGGTYNLSPNFSGFDLKYGTHLKMAPDTNIVAPSGYIGHVFRFSNGVGQCVMDGGHLYEASPVKRNWIGIMMQGGTNGVFFNYIENMVITDPYIVIDFNANTAQWVNANTFVNIKGWDYVRGIEFDFQGTPNDGGGFSYNAFRDLQFESGPMTTYGAKDIKHGYNAFYNVQFWDLLPGAISSTVDSSADHTIIIGGQMTYQGFVDNGRNTIILDAGHTKIISNSTILLAILNGTYHHQVNMPPLQSSQILNMSIIMQPTSGFMSGNKAQLSVSAGKPITVNIFGTVTNPKGGSVLLSITRPDGVVEQNQADVTSAGAFYYPMIFDKNSLTGQYKIDGSYQNSNLGSLLLNVTSDQALLSNQTNGGTNSGMTAPPQSNATLSARIKNDAKLWSQGEISNDVFLNSIRYLVTIGILEKPNESQMPLHQSVSIPTWLKNNAGWWTDGQISDSDFFSGIQYLLNNGIIRMP